MLRIEREIKKAVTGGKDWIELNGGCCLSFVIGEIWYNGRAKMDDIQMTSRRREVRLMRGTLFQLDPSIHRFTFVKQMHRSSCSLDSLVCRSNVVLYKNSRS